MRDFYIFFEDREAAEAAYRSIVGFLKKKTKEMKLDKNYQLNGRNIILIKPERSRYERYIFTTHEDKFKKYVTREAILTFEEAFSKILITEDLKE